MLKLRFKVHPNHLGTFLALLEEGFGKIKSLRDSEYWVIVQMQDDMGLNAFVERCRLIHLVLDVDDYEEE